MDAIHKAVENHPSALQHLSMMKERFNFQDPLPLADQEDDSTLPLPHVLADPTDSLANQVVVNEHVQSGTGKAGGKGKRRRSNNDPAQCLSRLAALLQASAGAGNLAASATVCYTFKKNLGCVGHVPHVPGHVPNFSGPSLSLSFPFLVVLQRMARSAKFKEHVSLALWDETVVV